MKILQVTNGYPPTARAGVEQYTAQLSMQLSQRGHQVQVFCREGRADLPEYTIVNDSAGAISVRRVVNNLLDVVEPAGYYRNAVIEQIFSRTLEEFQPAIVHFQHVIGLSAALIDIAARAHVPFLLTLHDYWFICPTVHLLTTQMALCAGPHHGADCRQCLGPLDQMTRRLHRHGVYRQLKAEVPEGLWNPAQRLATRVLANLPRTRGNRAAAPSSAAPYQERAAYMRDLLSRCNYLAAPSAFVRAAYADFGVPAQRIHVIPLGLDLELWNSRPATPARDGSGAHFAYIGTWYPHKGVDVLIRAFRQVTVPQARLSIYGYGSAEDPYGATLHRLARGDPRIRFMGAYDNRQLPQLLAAVDALVIPSRWHETFSIAAREALLAGVPVIASAVGAIPEVIRPGENGLLVPPGDVAALAQALEDWAAGLRRPRWAGPDPAGIRSIAAHAAEIEALYDQILHAPQAEG